MLTAMMLMVRTKVMVLVGDDNALGCCSGTAKLAEDGYKGFRV